MSSELIARAEEINKGITMGGKMLYNRIGKTYDHTRRADPYITGRLKHHVQIAPGKKYLDLACGTGNYTAAITGSGVLMYAIDHSLVMLEAAKSKYKEINWVLGDVEALRLQTATSTALPVRSPLTISNDWNRYLKRLSG